MSARADSRPVLPFGLSLVLLLLALPALGLLSLALGSGEASGVGPALAGLAALVGLGEPLPGHAQTIVELRLWRTLTTAGVGGCMALSGALVQGLFRNGLAAPSVLGITAGASLGGSVAIVALAGGSTLVSLADAGLLTVFVPICGFVGALLAVFTVTLIAGRGGRLSVPMLLLTGIAVNTCLAGVLSLIGSLALEHWEISRALQAWTFGTLDNRAPLHAVIVWWGLALAVLAAPFVAWELDLLQGGEDDAQALGVSTRRVRLLVVCAASLAAASAVSVAGQIAFIGLVVPHLLRLLAGRAHAPLLCLSVPGGAAFLLAMELLNRAVLGEAHLPPGVVMSLVGGPFFVLLLSWRRREVESW